VEFWPRNSHTQSSHVRSASVPHPWRWRRSWWKVEGGGQLAACRGLHRPRCGARRRSRAPAGVLGPWLDASQRAARRAADSQGPTATSQEAAAKGRVSVVAGLVERAGEKTYNSAVVIGETGELLHLHRKIHELDLAQELYATGGQLGVVETPLGVLGVSICARTTSRNRSASAMCWPGWARRSSCRLRPGPLEADHDNEREPYGELWRGAYAELHRWYDLPVVAVSNVGWIDEGPWKEGGRYRPAPWPLAARGKLLAQAALRRSGGSHSCSRASRSGRR